jgi:hypothetical protein
MQEVEGLISKKASEEVSSNLEHRSKNRQKFFNPLDHIKTGSKDRYVVNIQTQKSHIHPHHTDSTHIYQLHSQ